MQTVQPDPPREPSSSAPTAPASTRSEPGSTAPASEIDAALARYTDPAPLGRHAETVRRRAFGDRIDVGPASALAIPRAAAVIRGGTAQMLDAWPEPATVVPGDQLVLMVPGTDAGRDRYLAWLRAAARAGLAARVAVAPCSDSDGALHRLWAVAASRLCLPETVRIVARHDLLGIRLAQLALAMGADTLSGPVEPDRKLPIAGVPRPTETTRDGLLRLVIDAGLQPRWAAGTSTSTSTATTTSTSTE